MFEDPAKYEANLTAKIEERLMGALEAKQKQVNLEASYAKASQDHGADYMNGIMDELRQPENTDLMGYLAKQPDPVGAAINWKKERELLGQFGAGGIDAYKKQLEADALAKIRKDAGYTDSSDGQHKNNLVPSLTDIPSASGEVVKTVEEQEDSTFKELFG